MRFVYFKFENFKGIDRLEIDLRRNPTAKVYPLVGLNESGKTTILEAINSFIYKSESVAELIDDVEKKIDVHDWIPINRRDNFNGYIKIEAGLELNDKEMQLVKEEMEKQPDVKISEIGPAITFTQQYYFKNSIHDKEKDKLTWSHNFIRKTKKGGKIKPLTREELTPANIYIKQNFLPSILYFPNFLFEFPERIYLEENIGGEKEKFYRNIIQDILDSIENDLKIDIHLVERIKTENEHNRRNLNSVLGKMNRKLSDVIFNSWNQIFGKQIIGKEIILFPGVDTDGAYLEFNIQDNVDTYRVSERSLGFRWFFVFLLLTQFRTFRKKNKEVLFLLDEPASNLHPSAQTQLLKSFEKLSKVIYTTHSHYLINPQWLENTFVVKNSAIDYDKEEEYNLKQTNITIYKYRDFASKYPNQTNYFQPILEILDYAPSNLEFVPNVLITEGKNDFYTLNYFQQVIQKSKSPISIIPGTSATNLENIISLYLGWGKRFLVLLDSDKQGKAQKIRYLDIFGKSLDNLIVTYQDINMLWSGKELEELIEEADILNIQKLCYPNSNKVDKKTFNRSVQELLMKNQHYSFDEVSKRNLETIISFVKEKLEQ